MIKAEISYGDDSYIVKICGHAGYAPKGQDIVWAGVSALSSALLEAAVVYVNRENTAFFGAEVNDGCFEMRIIGVRDDGIISRMNALFLMLRAGLEQIERQYPSHLSLDIFEIPFKGNDNGTSEQTMNTYREEDKG